MFGRLEYGEAFLGANACRENRRVALGDQPDSTLDLVDILFRFHHRELDGQRFGDLLAILQRLGVFVQGKPEHVRGQQDTGGQ